MAFCSCSSGDVYFHIWVLNYFSLHGLFNILTVGFEAVETTTVEAARSHLQESWVEHGGTGNINIHAHLNILNLMCIWIQYDRFQINWFLDELEYRLMYEEGAVLAIFVYFAYVFSLQTNKNKLPLPCWLHSSYISYQLQFNDMHLFCICVLNSAVKYESWRSYNAAKNMSNSGSGCMNRMTQPVGCYLLVLADFVIIII